MVARFGITAGALLEAKTGDWKTIPSAAAHLAYHGTDDDRFRKHDRDVLHNKSQKGFYHNGGWDTREIEFPGYKGECEIAELDGKAVVEDPATMVEHFLLTNKPVIIRDFLRHDKGVCISNSYG